MNGPTTFLSLNANIGGQSKPIKDKQNEYLKEDQAKYIYKKVEFGSIINVDTIKQEMEQDLDRLNDTSCDINPYHDIIVNNAERQDTILSQMEQWSILSNIVNSIQYDRYPKNFHNLDIKAVDWTSYKKRYNKGEERQMLELDFRDRSEKLKE